jgi:hypothetical protein
MQKLNARVVSFCLILIFSQKMGLELWLHNWLHATTVTASVSSTQKGNASVQHLQVKCHCIDDALNPLMEVDNGEFDAHPPPFAQPFAADFSSWVSAEKTFSSLRGPPNDITSLL